MAKLRILSGFDMGLRDWAHLRHFFEALLRTDLAVVGKDLADPIDFCLWDTRPGAKVVVIWIGDPHVHAADGRDVRMVLDPEQLDVLPRIGLPRTHFDDLNERMLRGNPQPIINSWEQSRFHVFAALMRDPMYEILGPKLQPRFMRLSLSVPEWIFNTDWKDTRFIDVFFLGAVGEFYPLRVYMLKALLAQRGNQLLPTSKRHFYLGESLPDYRGALAVCSVAEFDAHQRWYADCLRHAKIMAFDGGVGNCPVSKYFEVMACGCLALAPMPRDGQILGFRDGVNMVVINADNFMEKIDYYLEHDAEREAIARRGWELAQRWHICSARVRDFVGKLERIRDGVPVAQVEAEFDAQMAALPG